MNTTRNRAKYDHWLQYRELWTLLEASALGVGLEPFSVDELQEIGYLSSEAGLGSLLSALGDEADRFLTLYTWLKDVTDSEQLEYKRPRMWNGVRYVGGRLVNPAEFVRLAERKFTLPSPLLEMFSNTEESEHRQAQDTLQMAPLPRSGIARLFPLKGDQNDNLERWASLARSASTNGLKSCRVSTGKGTAESLFDPVLVGDWLVQKGLLTRAQVNAALEANRR